MPSIEEFEPSSCRVWASKPAELTSWQCLVVECSTPAASPRAVWIGRGARADYARTAASLTASDWHVWLAAKGCNPGQPD